MGKHRSRLIILANVLSVVAENGGAKKTTIMYQAYLSYKLLVQYLLDLTTAGLLVCNDDTSFRITDKGRNFLTKFGQYSDSCGFVKKQLQSVSNQKSELEKMCPYTS